MLLPTPPFKENVFTSEVRRSISRLVHSFEEVVRERSQGNASVLFYDPLIVGDEEIIGITLTTVVTIMSLCWMCPIS